VWTDPVVIFSTKDGFVSQTVVMADTEGNVHLLFPYSDNKSPDSVMSGTIMYMRLHRGRWSAPTEVLASSSGRISQPGAVLDERGFLHVIWRGAGLVGSDLWYSRAHVSIADLSSAWTTPVRLSEPKLGNGGFGTAADITVTENGSLHVLYASMEGQLLYVRSDDGGRSWTEPPTTLVDARGTVPARPDLPRLIGDGSGRLHAAWTTLSYPSGWPPVGVFSSKSLDNGATWTEPIRIIGEAHGQVSMARQGRDVVHRVWNATGSLKERRHQRSTDGGETWSGSQKTITPRLGGGFSGFPALAVDSSGALHVVTAADGPDDGPSRSGGIYYVQSQGDHFTLPAFISRGTVGAQSVEQPSMTISEGNRLHVVWEDDFERLWYTSRLADAPALRPQQVPALALPTAAAVAPTRVPVADSLSRSAPAVVGPFDPNIDPSPGHALFAGAAAALIIIAASVLVRLSQSRG
jgi:hypothetical protein